MAKSETTEKTEKYPYKSAFKLFTDSKELVLQNLTPFLVLAAIPLFFSMATWHSGDRSNNWDRIGSSITGGEIAFIVGIGAFLLVASVIISIIIQLMMFVLQTETMQGKKPDLNHIYNVARQNWKRLVLLELEIGIRVIIGLILLIIPGLIVIRKYYLAPYAMLDKDLTPKEAMAESARLTQPHPGAVWGIIGVSILIGLTGIVPLFGGLIAAVLSMFYTVAPALRYKELEKLVKN